MATKKKKVVKKKTTKKVAKKKRAQVDSKRLTLLGSHKTASKNWGGFVFVLKKAPTKVEAFFNGGTGGARTRNLSRDRRVL